MGLKRLAALSREARKAASSDEERWIPPLASTKLKAVTVIPARLLVERADRAPPSLRTAGTRYWHVVPGAVKTWRVICFDWVTGFGIPGNCTT